MHLDDFFSLHPRLALAFSGGADSSYLLCAAREYGCDVHAYFIRSQFQPEFELDDARRLAASLDVPLTIESFDVLTVPNVAANPPDRCYYCKHALFSRLWELARADGFDTLCDGTNASDDVDDRPGMRAIGELDVLSPLRICGISKSELRERSRRAGLFTHDKPAYACLATRIPTGTKITAELLVKIERGEAALFSLGFTDFRVRIIGGAARIQLPKPQLERAFSLHGEIAERLSSDFDGVLLDLITR